MCKDYEKDNLDINDAGEITWLKDLSKLTKCPISRNWYSINETGECV